MVALRRGAPVRERRAHPALLADDQAMGRARPCVPYCHADAQLALTTSPPLVKGMICWPTGALLHFFLPHTRQNIDRPRRVQRIALRNPVRVGGKRKALGEMIM